MPVLILIIVFIIVFLIFLLIRRKQKRSKIIHNNKTAVLKLSDLPSMEKNFGLKGSEINLNSENQSFKIWKSIGGFNCYFLNYYYPKARFSNEQLSIDQIVFRQNIWGFKDGKKTIQNNFINSLKQCMVNTFENDKIKKFTLVCIPASTHIRTLNRFKQFSIDFCLIMDIKNGFLLIQNRIDRHATHNGELNRNDPKLPFLKIDASINGKDILLFDDLWTSGNSFLEIANHLIFLGARSVTGVFLGKTSHIIEN